jgi:hypothetical protein
MTSKNCVYLDEKNYKQQTWVTKLSILENKFDVIAEQLHASFKKTACNIRAAIYAPFNISGKRPNKCGAAATSLASDKSSSENCVTLC